MSISCKVSDGSDIPPEELKRYTKVAREISPVLATCLLVDRDYDVRALVLDVWGKTKVAALVEHTKDKWWNGKVRQRQTGFETFRVRLSYIVYQLQYPSRRKRMKINVDDLVSRWVPIVKGLTIAHTKDELDACEFESETHLTPLLSAPVKQLREFSRKLAAALKADPSVPLFVWTVFEQYDEIVVQSAKDADIKVLKSDLAERVAELVHDKIQPDLKDAIVGALKWRDQATLEKMETALRAGAKPRVRGRESCLFLEVGDHRVML